MPPSGPSTAPENSEAQAISTLVGSVRQSILVTSPARLSISDSSSVVGAWRYLTSRPTSRENGRQIAGNSQGFAATNSFSQRNLFTTSNTISQASTDTAPMNATMTTWTCGCTGRAAVTGSPSSRSLPTPVTVCAPVVRPVSSLIPNSRVLRALPADPDGRVIHRHRRLTSGSQRSHGRQRPRHPPPGRHARLRSSPSRRHARGTPPPAP